MYRILFGSTNDKASDKIKDPLSLISLIYCGKGFFLQQYLHYHWSSVFRKLTCTSSLRKTKIILMIKKDTVPTGMLC